MAPRRARWVLCEQSRGCSQSHCADNHVLEWDSRARVTQVAPGGAPRSSGGSLQQETVINGKYASIAHIGFQQYERRDFQTTEPFKHNKRGKKIYIFNIGGALAILAGPNLMYGRLSTIGKIKPASELKKQQHILKQMKSRREKHRSGNYH